jgi:phosphoribosyl-dephospho-CoA transferase
MELNPHDLLELKSVKDLISHSPLPKWVEPSITRAPFVVVRRSRAIEGFVAVGVRGRERNERYAAFMPVDHLLKRITPEQLAQERKWKKHPQEIFSCLEQVSHIMNDHSLIWGPVGSVGFELLSGKKTTSKTSDIDIVIRISEGFTTEFAKKIVSELIIQVRVDVQMESTKGAFSLSEYAASEGKPILIRTIDGPILKKINL